MKKNIFAFLLSIDGKEVDTKRMILKKQEGLYMRTFIRLSISFVFCILIFCNCTQKQERDNILPCPDCMGQPFLVTYAKVKSDRNSYFIKGEVIEVVQHGNRIKIIEDIKKNFEDNDIITVWGAGKCERIDPLYDSHVTDTLLLLITKTDLKENFHCPQCEYHEQPNDYMTIGCYYSVLKLSNGTVSGRITDAYEEITMLWADLSEQLEITK
jgi:hypothetical protein